MLVIVLVKLHVVGGILKSGLHKDYPGHDGPRNTSKVLSGDRRQVGEASAFRNPGTAEQSHVGHCEMDNHADTCCLFPILFLSTSQERFVMWCHS